MNLKVASRLKIINYDILPFRILETVIREKVFKKYEKKLSEEQLTLNLYGGRMDLRMESQSPKLPLNVASPLIIIRT